MLAAVPSMIGQFNMENIRLLLDMGYEVHVACNFYDTSVWAKERTKEFKYRLKELEIHYHQIEFCRSPKEVKRIIQSYRQMDVLLKREKFRFVHCHTPVAAAVCRLACHRNQVKVIYTAHGFHFYDGAPIKNWLFYYPVEWLCSWWTDVLITINKEDYRRAKRRLHAKKTVYVPGVGVDTEKFKPDVVCREKKREELGLKETDIMLLSVGELNKNKNHAVVIRALVALNNKSIHYFIAGQGELKEKLLQLAGRLGIRRRVHLLGYRSDVPELMQAADIYALPSIREGLNVSLMEAMASGLPCICSDIRGNRDLIENNTGGYRVDAMEEHDWEHAIGQNIGSGSILGGKNAEKIQSFFTAEIVTEKMRKIYAEYCICGSVK